jgi:hypothetical protein
MKIRNLLLALALVALTFASPAVADDTYSGWVATPTAGAQKSEADMILPDTNPVSVTVGTSTVVNLCASLPSNEYQEMLVQVTSGTVYLTGSITTPSTSGMTLPAATYGVMRFPLSAFPKDLGKIPVVAAAAQSKVLIWGVRTRKGQLGGR